MEILIALTAGVLVAGAAYLITGPRLLHLILGAALLAPRAGAMPEDVADPLPQALVLTAIVIGFGVLAFVVALSYRVQIAAGEDDIDRIAAGGGDGGAT